MEKLSFFSTKISPKFKKFLTIFGCISFGFLALFVLFIWYLCLDNSSLDKKYVQRIIQENASRSVEGVSTSKVDEEVTSRYKEEISLYIKEIRVNLIIMDAIFSYTGENPLECSQYIKNLEENMNMCDFSNYPYSKELIFPEELRSKIDNLEVLTKSLCSTLSESSKQILVFLNLEDTTKMKDIYIDIYDMNQDAYEKRVVIDTICDEVEELISL